MTRTKLPTAARNGFEAGVERFLVVLAWAAQALALVTYGGAMVASGARHHLPGLPLAMLGLFTVSMTVLWGLSLSEEQRVFYNRVKAVQFRKLGLLAHGSILLVACGAAAYLPAPGRYVTWGVLVAVGFTALGVWLTRMHLLFLPPEDQAVVDAIAEREAQARAAEFDASEKERRHARLSAIVGSLGYELTDRAPQAPRDEPEPQLRRWTVPPRKHEPLVYFIRNGNRLKIGTTTELKRRIRTLSLRPENVVLLVPGSQPVERAFHAQFADLRVGNSEWFAYTGPLVTFVTDQNLAARKEQTQ